LKSYNAIIASLLAIIGFAPSCDFKTEYGTPSAEFIVTGTVVSSETNLPIENIRVIMQRDTTLTNKDGNFEVADKYGFPTDQTYTIEYRDIDGESNIAYEDLDTIVEFKNPKFTGGDGHWFSGETRKELDVKLTRKK